MEAKREGASRTDPGRADLARAGAGRAATVRGGIGALGKCLLVLVGVPAALVRLWLVLEPPGQLLARAPGGPGALVAQVLLGLVALGWLAAGSQLAGDLARALLRRDLRQSSWSGRWAVRLVALVLMLGSGLAAATTSRSLQGPSAPDRTVALIAGARGGESAPSSAVASAPSSDADGEVAQWILAALGIGALGSIALASRASLLRRAAAATRRFGERQPDTSTRVGEVTAWLRAFEDATALDWIDGTSRFLWKALQGWPAASLVEVHLLRFSGDGVELRLREPLERAPDGFVVLEHGAWWRLDPSLSLADLLQAGAGCGRMLPGLVPVGEDGDATYLVNVAAGRRLAVDGEAGPVRRALACLVLALRTLPWADELAVELLDLAAPDPSEQCYHLNASSPEELRALERVRCDPSAPATSPPGRLGVPWARQPMIVAASEPNDLLEARFSALGRDSGIISHSGISTERLVLDGEHAWLEPLGLRLRPLAPRHEQLELVEAVLRAAAAPPVIATAPVPNEPLSRTAVRPPIGLHPPGRVEVRLLNGEPSLAPSALGPVRERDLARVVELLAYLHLHDGTATIAELREAIFGGQRTPGSLERTHNIVAAARAALAGSEHPGLVVVSFEDSVRVADELSLDWHRVRHAIEGATCARPAHARRLLRDALELVGPRPCALGVPGYDWLVASGLRQQMLATIVDGAHQLAQLALADGDAALARVAIDRGLHAEPHAELLVQDLLRACALDGDLQSAQRAFGSLEVALARLCGNEPSLETRALYGQLLRAETS